MAGRKMSLANQLRGTIAALKSKKTPPQLLEGLRRHKANLEAALAKERRNASGRFS